jgi:ABC-type transport system involved in cytochrome c biogenesis permease component
MLSYRTRRRLALLILLVGLPLYLVVAITAVNWMDATWGRQPIWAEVLIYLALGFLWILPFRFIFRGIGKPDPDAEKQTERSGDRSA